MLAGRLRERVRFDRRVIVADDGYGNEVAGWATFVGPVAAEISPMRSREQALAAKLEERNVVEITVRWQPVLAGLTDGVAALGNADRAVDARTGKVYDIHVVDNKDLRKRYLTVLAESGGAIG